MANIMQEAVSNFYHGSKSGILVDAVQLTTRDIVLRKGVLVLADPDNGGNVWVGLANLTTDVPDLTGGLKLTPGDAVFLEIAKPSTIYVVSDNVPNKKVFWTGV